MNLFQLCRKFLSGNESNPMTAKVIRYSLSESHCSELYRTNVIIYRCVNLIAQNIANIPCVVKNENGETVKKHALSQLIEQPNQHNNWCMFMNSVVTDLLLYGNSFLFKKEDEVNKLNAQTLKIINDNTGNPYEYQHENGTFKASNKQLLHIKLCNPYAPWNGLSPVSSVSKSALLYDTITNHNQSILDNGGRLSGALVSNSKLTDEQREQLQNAISEKYSGNSKAGKMLVLEGGLDWKEMSLSPKDMDFNEGKIMAAREIALAFGIPPVMLGMESSALNHYKEARLHFWEDTLLPLANLILNNLENWLGKSENLKLEYDFTHIPALSAKKDEYKKHIDALSFLTRNEKRQLCGYQKQEEI